MTAKTWAQLPTGRSQIHPKTQDQMRQAIQRLGFSSVADFDNFWTKWNTRHEDYEPPSESELEYRQTLIDRAINGETVDLKAAYETRED